MSDDAGSIDHLTRSELKRLARQLREAIRTAPDRWAAGTAIQTLADVEKRLRTLDR
jgi:hypothetical protein